MIMRSNSKKSVIGLLGLAAQGLQSFQITDHGKIIFFENKIHFSVIRDRG